MAVDVEIRPRPAKAERRAILAALAAARRARGANPYESAWRRVGLDYAATRPGLPRRSRGADLA